MLIYKSLAGQNPAYNFQHIKLIFPFRHLLNHTSHATALNKKLQQTRLQLKQGSVLTFHHQVDQVSYATLLILFHPIIPQPYKGHSKSPEFELKKNAKENT